MRVDLERTMIRLVPETEVEKVYLETVLGLKSCGECCIAQRVAPTGLPLEFAYVAVRKSEPIASPKDMGRA